ncbi:MAG: riboflavin synthase [Candidatus Cloacimonetes bacterium]|nr:riboflavin synthase [Candidatus Cloacimonadota bacterium]
MLLEDAILFKYIMFTGIIQEIGTVRKCLQKGTSKVIVIECTNMLADLTLGDSIACDGLCLTVSDFSNNSITVEAMPETIKTTTLSLWYPGYQVNLERALRADSKLDGHIVQGHVDCITSVLQIIHHTGSLIIEFALPSLYKNFIVDKGSIAVNGVSLTVASLNTGSFSVSIVTFTQEHTNLNNLKPGSKVNLEFDIIGKYINRFLTNANQQLTREKLLEKGF